MNCLTEEEALRLVCPVRRPYGEPTEPQCIASRCMAWQWEVSKSITNVESCRKPVGFCGLFRGQE